MADSPIDLVRELEVDGTTYRYYAVDSIDGGQCLPYALRILLENVLREGRGSQESLAAAHAIVEAGRAGCVGSEVEFMPWRACCSRTSRACPCSCDFAVDARGLASAWGATRRRSTPRFPCDLVIDHSVIADDAGCAGALAAEHGSSSSSATTERYDFLEVGAGARSRTCASCLPERASATSSTSSSSPAWSCAASTRAPGEAADATLPPCTSTRWWAPTATRRRPTASAFWAGASAASRPRPPRSGQPHHHARAPSRGRHTDGRACGRA